MFWQQSIAKYQEQSYQYEINNERGSKIFLKLPKAGALDFIPGDFQENKTCVACFLSCARHFQNRE